MENFDKSEILNRVEKSIKRDENILNRGYQGKVYFYQDGERKFVVKAPIGRGLGRFIRQAMIRHEAKVYSRLNGISGVPHCHGLVGNRYLVLDYIDAEPFEHARIEDHEAFFEELLALIKELHKIGIAHTDLKKKDNLLVADEKRPYVVDFGVAVIRKPGFAPVNHWLYRIASTFDFNAWVKLKYDGQYEIMSERDATYYNRTVVEKVARWIKENIMRR